MEKIEKINLDIDRYKQIIEMLQSQSSEDWTLGFEIIKNLKLTILEHRLIYKGLNIGSRIEYNNFLQEHGKLKIKENDIYIEELFATVPKDDDDIKDIFTHIVNKYTFIHLFNSAMLANHPYIKIKLEILW